MLALRLISKDKGGKRNYLQFVGSKKQGTSEKVEEVEATLYTLYWDFQKILCKVCQFFNSFLVINRILKALFSFFFDF